MKTPAEHPTFAFGLAENPRPNVKVDMTYREGMENEPPPFHTYHFSKMWLAIAAALAFAAWVFWPAIAEILTPVRLSFVWGTFFGVCVGMAIVGLVTKPCGDEDAAHVQDTTRIDPETVRACALAGSIRMMGRTR